MLLFWYWNLHVEDKVNKVVVVVKSLAWRSIMGNAVLEDFRGKGCAFVPNWLQSLCRIWRYLNWIQALRSFEYMNVLSCVYNEWITIPIPAIQYNNKKLNRGPLLWPAACMLINKVSDDACQWIYHDDMARRLFQNFFRQLYHFIVFFVKLSFFYLVSFAVSF